MSDALLGEICFTNRRFEVITNLWIAGQNMEKSTVLVVDGESLIRISAIHMVEDAGYSSLQAANADEAIQLLEHRSEIRAVFTDVKMSGSMNGLALAHAICGRWPPIHVIITSGLDIGDKLPLNGRFIRKPYTFQQVSAVLHDFSDMPPDPSIVAQSGHHLC